MFQLSAQRLPRILGETDCWSSGGPHKSLSSASPRWGSCNTPPSWLNTSDKDVQAGACGRPPSAPGSCGCPAGPGHTSDTPSLLPHQTPFSICSQQPDCHPFPPGSSPEAEMSVFCQCSESHANAASRASLHEEKRGGQESA